jgi:catechol 2,3-dioxygenase-like lactoylglutathione lyase family enzyme
MEERMLAQARLMAFVATQDAKRAKDFYEHVLGLQLVADEAYALVFDAHGTELRVQKAGAFEPHVFTALGWEVPDIHAALRAMKARGIEAERFAHLEADELGVWNAGHALVTWFKDPDGNLLSLTQHVRKP